MMMTTSTAQIRRVTATVMLAAANMSNATDAAPDATGMTRLSPMFEEHSNTAPASIASTVLQPADLPALSLQVLRRLLGSPDASLDLLVAAMGELVTRGAPEVASVIAQRLRSPRLANAWRVALVHHAEAARSTDPEVRAALAAGLASSALLFRDRGDVSADAPLWAAIRSLSGLVKAPQTVFFLEFLRPGDRPTTRQAALQALQNILVSAPAAAAEVPLEVKSRLADLAAEYLRPEWLVSGENVALAANAYAAAHLARVERGNELQARLERLGRPVLERQVALVMKRAAGDGA